MLRAQPGLLRASRPLLGRLSIASRTLMTGTPYSELTIGVPKETVALERRVSQTPESITKLTKEGWNVLVEKGAGVESSFTDAMYEKAGAKIVDKEAACAQKPHSRRCLFFPRGRFFFRSRASSSLSAQSARRS